MTKDVYDYFERLEDKGFRRQNGVLIADERCKSVTEHPMAIFDIDGKKYYAKSNIDETHIQGVCASRMYNDLGIINPPITLMRIKDKEHPKGNLYTLSQNVNSIPVYKATLASQVLQKAFPKSMRFYSKWDILSNNALRSRFLKYMTPECLNQLIDIFLLDELRTDVDRHTDNYFLIKLPNEDKFSNVIPIDMDNVEILYNAPKNKGEFHQFLHRFYQTCTPTERVDHETYIERIETLRDMLSYDRLSEQQIKLLRAGVNYDFPVEIKKFCQRHNLDAYLNSVYNPYAMLWEYLQNSLGKDLEL